MSIINSAASGRIYALHLKVRPLAKGTLMPFSGELVHGAWMRWLRDASPEIAQYVHDGSKRRIFTCSSLQFPLPAERLLRAQKDNIHLPLTEQQTYPIRITLLRGDLFPLLYEMVMNMNQRSLLNDKQKGGEIQIGKQLFALDAMMSSPDDPSGWTGYSSYDELVSLAQRQHFGPSHPIVLEFASLTTFHRLLNADKKYDPYYALYPSAQYLFPGLARRWQELAPPELAMVVQKERIEKYIAEEGIIIDDYQLQTHHVHFIEYVQRGFIGTCRYLLRGPDEPPTADSPLTIRQQLQLLAWFAFYVGAGYKTAMGMGQTRLVPATAP
jgi:CRISPR-associated endoribonuclease Cas6